ncbi:MAG: hypothetical protein J5486_06070 [Bacteroidaceae bacterium]|nr:hypothetical protein [Bacteroidaceae bacterium]
MSNHRLYILFLLLISTLLPLSAQTASEKNQIRLQRFSKIDYYHYGFGLEAASSHNFTAGPKVFVGLGSYRNLITADAGLKLLFTNPFGSSTEERVSQVHLPIFATASLNFLRWQKGSAYIGAEADYHLSLGATHHTASTSTSDNDLSCAHASASLRLGVRLSNWDIGLYYEYDLAPAFDQKHVYETAAYDYEALHDNIFDRTRFGISISRALPF